MTEDLLRLARDLGDRSRSKVARNYHWVAQVFETRGQVEKAMREWEQARDLRDFTVDSMIAQGMLKSPALSEFDLFRAHRRWAGVHAHRADVGTRDFEGGRRVRASSRHRFSRPSQRPLRIGYACAWWEGDTAKSQALPFIREHDRSRYRIVGYGIHASPGQERDFDEFYVVDPSDTQGFVQTVRSHEIDILIELTGLSPCNRFLAMAERCAPIQVSYLNHAATTGLGGIDYVIADETALPPAAAAFFTEKVVYLDGCFFSFNFHGQNFPDVVMPPVLQNGYVTFGCFGSPVKYNDQQIELWAQLLHRVPGSRLFLAHYQLVGFSQTLMWRRFERWGISPDRIRLDRGGPRDAMLPKYGEMDICLDTWPYCGGNSVAEPLWLGVPVVTLKGDRFSASYGASLVAASGLADLVATTPQDFVEIAARLAADQERLVHLRAHLRSMMIDHGFADSRRLARQMEKAFDRMARETFGAADGQRDSTVREI